MDKNTSQLAPSDEGFQYSLVSGKDVEILAPVQKVSTSTVFFLEIRNWESENRSYKLKIETSPESDKFVDSLNWMTNTLQLTFRLPPDYAGGPEGFLQRLDKVFDGSYPLGITSLFVGKEAIEGLRCAQPTSTGKELPWSRVVKRIAGCAGRRVKIPETDMMLFKITPDGYSPVGLVVNTKDHEYWRFVGDKAPSRFLELMVIPILAWQCIVHWCNQFDEARNGNEELLKDLIDAARKAAKEAGFNEALMVTMQDNEELGPGNFDNALQLMREEAVRQLSLKSEVFTADSGSTHDEEVESRPDSNDAATRSVNTIAGQRKSGSANEFCWKTEGSALKGGDDLPRRKGRSRGQKKRGIKMAPKETEEEVTPPDTDNGVSGVHNDYVVVDVAAANTITAALTPRDSPTSISSSSSFQTAPDIQESSSSLCTTHQDSMSPPPSPRSPSPVGRLQTVMEGPEGNGDETDTGASTPRCPPSPETRGQQPCQPDNKTGTSKETMAVALPEPDTHQSQATAIDASTISPGEEISTRSDRGSPGPDPELDASLTSADKPCSSGEDSQATAAAPEGAAEKAAWKKKNKAERKKRNRKLAKEQSAQLSESAPGPDNSQQDVPAPPTPPSTQPAGKNKKGKKKGSGTKEPAATASNEDTSSQNPSTHYAGPLIVGRTPEEAPKPYAGPLIVGRTPEKAPAPYAGPLIVGRTSEKEPKPYAGPLIVGRTPEEAPARGFGSPATSSFTPGAQPSHSNTATPAVRAVGTGPSTFSATPSTTLGSGANTGPASGTIPPPSPVKYQLVEKPKPGEGVTWDLTIHQFECAFEECKKECNLWDGQSVICPRCGPYSVVQYCGKKHMREDLNFHWLYCGQKKYALQHYCVASSIPPDLLKGGPMIPNLHSWNTPQRHRQAVWFKTGHREGDYFLFTDWTEMVLQGIVPGQDLEPTCSSQVSMSVKFDDPEERDRFRRILAVCLFAATELRELVTYLYRMIRDKLRELDHWNAHVEVMLRLQFSHEMGFKPTSEMTGDRHACPTSWSGLSPRHCRDSVCVQEREAPLVGQLAHLGHGFEHLCNAMEADYWVLRVNRITHPTCKKPEARMRGEGYPQVAPQDRREFRRGWGWDGAGSGPIEIETHRN